MTAEEAIKRLEEEVREVAGRAAAARSKLPYGFHDKSWAEWAEWVCDAQSHEEQIARIEALIEAAFMAGMDSAH